jgi:5-formaminoimidazole-4-carboxamide-1-(beta)-D-ribofuranosyl 5'-monophosphate synthetase
LLIFDGDVIFLLTNFFNMITQEEIKEVLAGYDPKNITIGVLGGHSALDVCHGATKLGFDTVVVCQKGREQTYEKYYRRRDDGMGGEKGCVGNIILVDKFENVVDESVQEELRGLNTVFLHNRYFWVYCDFEKVENDFKVPILGLRQGVAMEERDHDMNQYKLLEEAGIRIPKILREGGKVLAEEELRAVLTSHFDDGGGPLIIKANEATRSYERAFFVISNTEDYFSIGGEMVKSGKVNAEDLERSVIEEYIIGAHVNLNFFYSPISGELELMGTDTRRQTNLDGFLRLDAREQSNLLESGFKPTMVETGHYAVTMKESLVEKAYDIGEKFVEVMKKEAAPGMIGPFALQGAVASLEGREEFVIFDVSMRIPGSPGTAFTPYSGYLYGQSLSYGERIAKEVALGLKEGKLDELCT